MMIFLYILAYILMGALTMFGVMILSFRQGWDDVDRQFMSVLSWVLWPAIGPIMIFRSIYQILHSKAKDIGYKKSY